MNRVIAKFITYLLLMSFIGGCTSLKPLNINQPRANIVSAIKINDKITVRTKSNTTLELIVKEITPIEIIGHEQTIAFSEIKSLQIEQLSNSKTISAIVLGFLGVHLLVLSIFLLTS